MAENQTKLWRGLKIRLDPNNAKTVLLSRRLSLCDNVVVRYLQHFPQEAWKDFIEKIITNKLPIKTLEMKDIGIETEWPVSLIPALKNIEEVILLGEIEDFFKEKLLRTIVDADRSSLKLRRLRGLNTLNMEEKLLAQAAIRLESLDEHWIFSCDQVRGETDEHIYPDFTGGGGDL